MPVNSVALGLVRQRQPKGAFRSPQPPGLPDTLRTDGLGGIWVAEETLDQLDRIEHMLALLLDPDALTTVQEAGD